VPGGRGGGSPPVAGCSRRQPPPRPRQGTGGVRVEGGGVEGGGFGREPQGGGGPTCSPPAPRPGVAWLYQERESLGEGEHRLLG
jgi:hypothetical protein